MSNLPAIEGRGLVRVFPGGVRALDDVSLAIPPGAFFTLLGPSGCGKTTLLRAIAGLETLDAGTLTLDGVDLAGLPPWKRPVNTVFQSYAIFPHLTVAQNIAFGLEMLKRPQSAVAARVAEMLALVQLEGFGARKSSQLSGGQLQRVALARALAPAPRVLLLDEPLSALDLKLRTEMQLELKRIQSRLGITFIFVTHDQHEALTMSDRIAVMQAGKIRQIGTPEEIYDHPASRFVADFIGETNLIHVTGEGAALRLPNGATLPAPSHHTGPAWLAIRPERLRLDADAPLRGAIEHAVFQGSDTTYHIRLAENFRLRVRMQNAGSTPRLAGETGIAIPPDALRLLTA